MFRCSRRALPPVRLHHEGQGHPREDGIKGVGNLRKVVHGGAA